MPKPNTFPTLYDNVLKLNISNFNKWGYLKGEQIVEGVLKWSIDGEIISRINYKIDTTVLKPFIE